MTSITDQTYEALGPFREDDITGDLQRLVAAMAGPADLVYEIVGEAAGAVGWSAVLDPDRCPTSCLPWLAQWVGVEVTPSMWEADIREAVALPEGYERGSQAAMEAAIRRTLSGTKRVVIRPRTPTATDLYIRTFATETPDQAATLAAILVHLPAWLILDYDVATGQTYIDVDAQHADYDAVEAAYDDYTDLAETLPS